MVMSSYTEINPNPSNRSRRELRVAISGSVGYKMNLSGQVIKNVMHFFSISHL